MSLEDLAFGKDLLFYVLKFAGQSASTTDDYADQAKAAIRSNYWELLCLEKWPFAMASSPGVITTVAKSAVTVSSISGSTITLSATIAASMAGRKFYVDSNQAVYRISAHTAGTGTLTLDATYVETETSGAGTIYQDEYALNSNCMKVWSPISLRGQFEGGIDIISPDLFKAKYGVGQTSAIGVTDAATIIRNNSSGNMQIQIAPWSEDRINIEYDYTEFADLDFSGAGSADTPKLRKEDRWVVAEFALFTVFRNKDDTLADSAYIRAHRKLEEMKGRLIPYGKPQMWARSGNSLSIR